MDIILKKVLTDSDNFGILLKLSRETGKAFQKWSAQYLVARMKIKNENILNLEKDAVMSF